MLHLASNFAVLNENVCSSFSGCLTFNQYQKIQDGRFKTQVCLEIMTSFYEVKVPCCVLFISSSSARETMVGFLIFEVHLKFSTAK